MIYNCADMTSVFCYWKFGSGSKHNWIFVCLPAQLEVVSSQTHLQALSKTYCRTYTHMSYCDPAAVFGHKSVMLFLTQASPPILFLTSNMLEDSLHLSFPACHLSSGHLFKI